MTVAEVIDNDLEFAKDIFFMGSFENGTNYINGQKGFYPYGQLIPIKQIRFHKDDLRVYARKNKMLFSEDRIAKFSSEYILSIDDGIRDIETGYNVFKGHDFLGKGININYEDTQTEELNFSILDIGNLGFLRFIDITNLNCEQEQKVWLVYNELRPNTLYIDTSADALIVNEFIESLQDFVDKEFSYKVPFIKDDNITLLNGFNIKESFELTDDRIDFDYLRNKD